MPPTPKKPPSTSRNRNLMIAIGVALIIVVALVVGSVVLTGGNDSASSSTTGGSTSTAFLDGIPQDREVLGQSTAKVTLIQFEDLQCPICKRYTADAFPGIVDEYVRPGRIMVRFVGLSFIGPDSEAALRYVVAAGKQGKLWQMNDLLYQKQGAENSGWLTDALAKEAATELGLDYDKLASDASSPSVTQVVNSMAAEGQQKQIPGTPWFYVQVGQGDAYEVQPTALDVAAFRPILDDALRG